MTTQTQQTIIMKKTSLLLASIALALSGVAQADQLEDIQKSGTLRVGTTGDYKPSLTSTAKPTLATISMLHSTLQNS